MKTQDYSTNITTKDAPKETFDKISQPAEWWSLNYQGNASAPGDVFTVRFKNGDWYTIQLSELIRDKKIVWDVIDAEQTWHENRQEWVGTRIVWEISPENDGTKVTMTHQGLVPEFECYDKCKMGWDYLIRQSLYKYLAEGVGMPV